jgi:hypothetical protein
MAVSGLGGEGTARRRQPNSVATIRFREKQAECEAFPPSTALAAHSAAPTPPGHASIVIREDGEMWLTVVRPRHGDHGAGFASEGVGVSGGRSALR